MQKGVFMDKKFQGVYAVICTPFTEDDKIDETALRKHLRYLVDQGNVHGIIPTGSTVNSPPCLTRNFSR